MSNLCRTFAPAFDKWRDVIAGNMSNNYGAIV